MSRESIRQLLEYGASSPSRRVDVEAILRRGRRLRRARAISTSMVVIAVLAAGGIVIGDVDSIFRTERVNSELNHSTSIPRGWTELPLPPEVRDGMSVVWAGSQLLAWGGCDPAVADRCEPTAEGFGFDPATQSWTAMEESPRAGANADVVWTGTEAVFLLEDGGRLEAQIYDPANGGWRVVAPAPVALDGTVSVWTGSEVIAWGESTHEQSGFTGAAYDPARDSWRQIANAPIGLNLASAVWTGREMLVFGSLLDDRNIADTEKSVGAAYDPVTDTWRELPPSDLSPQATSAVWVGDRLVAWDYEVRSQEYDPATNAWSDPVKMPLDFSECYPDSVVVSGRVFAFFCGRAALYEPATGTWEEIRGGLVEEELESKAYGRPIPLWRFAQLASSGDVVFLLTEGITLAESGEACFGCSGSPVSFWAYRMT